MDTEYPYPVDNSTDTILMVRPSNFGSNPETLADNAFQSEATSSDSQEEARIKEKAMQEFDNYVSALREEGVNVIVVEDSPNPVKPDAVFPNNWFTTHSNGTLILYPMKPASRRLQRNNPVLSVLAENYIIKATHNLSMWEQKSVYLQGTGSMVLDHQNRIAYACISERTHEPLFAKVCSQILHYEPVFFEALDSQGKRYYHTNVVMAVCSDFVVLGTPQVKQDQREKLKAKIFASNGSTSIGADRRKKELVELTEHQINNFCGNILEVKNKKGEKLLTMSETAFSSLREDQLATIRKYCRIVKVDLTTIQNFGGGGTRCTMAEIFLQSKKQA